MRYGFFAAVLALTLAGLPALAAADIVAWTDDSGVTHYTNLQDEVPAQQATRVVVDEDVWLGHGSAVPDAEASAPAQPQPLPDTEDEVLRAYLAGLDSGLGRGADAGAAGNVYISGPLALTIAPPIPYPSAVPIGYDWWLPGYSAFLPGTGAHRRPMHDRFGTHRHPPAFPHFISAAGPPPLGAAGPPPLGAAGPPPLGAAGRPPLRGAGQIFGSHLSHARR